MQVRSFTPWRLERRCSRCGHAATTAPPALDKRLVYLDQWVISEFANTLDPVLREKKRGRLDPFWLTLFRQVERLVKLHVIACPESPVHRREAVITPYAEQHRRLYEHLAVGVRFDEPLVIHAAQLTYAFRQHLLHDEHASELWAPRRYAVHGHVNAWQDRIRVSVAWPRPQEAASERSSRLSADALLKFDSDQWSKERGKPVQDWIEFHRLDITGVVLRCFDQRVFGVYWMTCEGWVRALMERGTPEREARRSVRDFLHSDFARSVPYCEIASRLFAGMSTKLADEGQKRPADHGHLSDIQAIAAYLPYCDGICVDGYFAEILRKQWCARALAPYGASVFFPAERDDFLRYLVGLENGVADELRNTVLGVYGASWLDPYETILDRQRAKEARAQRSPPET